MGLTDHPAAWDMVAELMETGEVREVRGHRDYDAYGRAALVLRCIWHTLTCGWVGVAGRARRREEGDVPGARLEYTLEIVAVDDAAELTLPERLAEGLRKKNRGNTLFAAERYAEAISAFRACVRVRVRVAAATGWRWGTHQATRPARSSTRRRRRPTRRIRACPTSTRSPPRAGATSPWHSCASDRCRRGPRATGRGPCGEGGAAHIPRGRLCPVRQFRDVLGSADKVLEFGPHAVKPYFLKAKVCYLPLWDAVVEPGRRRHVCPNRGCLQAWAQLGETATAQETLAEGLRVEPDNAALLGLAKSLRSQQDAADARQKQYGPVSVSHGEKPWRLTGCRARHRDFRRRPGCTNG